MAEEAENRAVNERQIPTVGRIVHYTNPTFAYGDCRAALIVRVFTKEPNGTVNLTVFPDWTNDEVPQEGHDPRPAFWATSVQNEEVPGTGPRWHWPERA